MASVRFFTKSKRKPAVINVRFKRGSKFDISRTTSLTVDPKYWNNKQGAVKSLAEFEGKLQLKKTLQNLKGEILNSYNKDFSNGRIINSEWLNNTILHFFDQDKDLQTEYLSDYAELHLKSLPSKVLKNGQTGVKKTTFAKYKGNLKKLKEFEAYKSKRFLISEVNMNFHREFIQYLKNENHLNYNSIGKYLTMVKTICLDANIVKGIKVNEAIQNGNFKTTKEKTSFVTLSEKEIETIFYKDFSHTPYLDNARNWLIIGVWIGARVSDLLKISSKNIKGQYLEYTAKKTGDLIVMPLHWQVEAVIDRLDGKLPKPITAQKFNDYIKIVCKNAGIDESIEGSKKIDTGLLDKNNGKIWRKVRDQYKKHELVSTHICRRSFATNHYGKLPTPVIMSATGHKTEKMLLNYIGKAPKDNADILAEYWKKTRSKKENPTKMEILKKA